MPCRDWLIKARLQHNWTRAQAARKARISERLYTWLEIDDEIITHPNFVRRIKNMYHLSDAEFNSMVNPKHHIGRKVTKKNEIDGIIICPDCMDSDYRRSTDDYIE